MAAGQSPETGLSSSIIPRESLTRSLVSLPLARTPFGPEDDVWRTLPQQSNFKRMSDGGLASQRTQVCVCHDKQFLYVRFECSESSGPRLRIQSMTMGLGGDRVELLLDAKHEHRQFLRFQVNPHNKRGCQLCEVVPSRVLWDREFHVEPAEIEWQSAVTIQPLGWLATVFVPLESLGLDPDERSCVWGLNFVRHRFVESPEITIWNHEGQDPYTPWAFGDLYFERRPLVIEQIDLGSLSLAGENLAHVQLRNLEGAERTYTVEISTHSGSQDGLFRSSAAEVQLPARGTEVADIPYSFDSRETKRHALRLKVSDQGRIIYDTRYCLGEERGLPLYFAPIAGKEEDAAPVQSMTEAVLSKLPRLRRATTREGAPSDFCLVDAQAELQINLMEPGAVAKLADVISSRFETDEERLVAACLLVHQPAMLTRARERVEALSSALGPLSAIRFGMGGPRTFAHVALGLIEKVKDSEGNAFAGQVLYCGRHALVLVSRGEHHVVLDPCAGRVFRRPEDDRLVTFEELLEEPELAEATGHGLRELCEGERVFSSYPTGVFPADSPPE